MIKQEYKGKLKEWKTLVSKNYNRVLFTNEDGVWEASNIEDRGKIVGLFNREEEWGWYGIDKEEPEEPIENSILKAMERKTFPNIVVSKQYSEKEVLEFGKKYNLVYAGEDIAYYYLHSAFVPKELSKKEEDFLYIVLDNMEASVSELMEIVCKSLGINKLTAAGILSGLSKKDYYIKGSLTLKGLFWVNTHKDINKTLLKELGEK